MMGFFMAISLAPLAKSRHWGSAPSMSRYSLFSFLANAPGPALERHSGRVYRRIRGATARIWDYWTWPASSAGLGTGLGNMSDHDQDSGPNRE